MPARWCCRASARLTIASMRCANRICWKLARDFIESGKPFLGICVGYQALFERSEEFNSCAAGLGVFQGSVVRFSEKPGLKIPQIGWNQTRRSCRPIARSIAASPDGSYVYFVHSFFPQPVGSIHRRDAHGLTATTLRRPSGGTMFTPRNFTRRKARRSDCSC